MTGRQTDLNANSSANHRLWIDGVGGFLVCSGRSISVGSNSSADFAVRAPISRQHATFKFDDENWSWWRNHKQHETRQTLTRSTEDLKLGEGVVLSFSQSHPWSQTASLKLQSSHRSLLGVDGCILMRRECLLGPTHNCHIRCSDWSETIVLTGGESEFQWHRLNDVRPTTQVRSKQSLPVDETVTITQQNSTEVRIRLENLEFSKVK